MKPLLDQAFWSDPDIEAKEPRIKLAALWLITNSRTSLLGVCGASPKRFQFETGLDPQVLFEAVEGLPRAFKRFGDVIFVRNYIRHQFGSHEKLTKNNFFISLRSLFASIKDTALAECILEDYPEFSTESDVILPGKRDHTVASGLRMQILERDEYTCLFTGEKLTADELQIDHVLPRAKGGKTEAVNLVAISKRMNNLKKHKDLKAFCAEQGFDFILITEMIKTRASKPLLGLSKPKDSKGRKGKVGELPQLPQTLESVDGFAEQWELFIQHRKEIRKPMTPLAATGILETLAERPTEAVFGLDTAIRRSWQGFEWSWVDKEKPADAPKPKAPAVEPAEWAPWLQGKGYPSSGYAVAPDYLRSEFNRERNLLK